MRNHLGDVDELFRAMICEWPEQNGMRKPRMPLYWRRAPARESRWRRLQSPDCAAGSAMVRDYFGSAFSTAPISSDESGSTPESNREITLPFPSTRNLVKFHFTSPPALSVRNL